MAETLIVHASEVQEGDYLPGLGEGYVIEVEDSFDIRNGDYNTRLGTDGMVLITFNDASGDECYLILTEDNPVQVFRGA